jgi:hypothetical protein
VRRLRGTRNPGLNRVHWDLAGEPTRAVRLRTSPLYAPEIKVGPDGTRPGGGQLTLLEPPGTYTVQLTVDGRTLTQPLEVRKDPHSGGTLADIQAQRKVLLELHDAVNRAADVVNRIELVRSQLQQLGRLDDPAIRKSAEALEAKFIALEGNLIEPRMTGRGQDGVRWGSKLHGKLMYLANGLRSGDFGPTAQQLEVQKELEGRLQKLSADAAALVKTELGTFNEELRRKNLPTIVVDQTTKGS